MLLTSTIRRKLLLGLGLVLAMLLVLSAGGIGGLSALRNVVRGLDYGINEAPRQAELAGSIALLFEPLLLNGRTDAACAFQQQKFRENLGEARRRIEIFRRKLDDMPLSELPAGQRPVTDALLREVAAGLNRLEQRHHLLADRVQRAPVVAEMLEEAARLQTVAERVPDPVGGLSGTLNHARDVYRSSLVTVWLSSAVVLVLFIGLVRYAYRGIFAPLHKLHQGALRVAHGDFDYRVSITTRDEMAELADAFNQMTSRFQEIAADLDQQVQERSRQLVRSERLAGVGFLASGVAHEINNPLSAIAMASESLEQRTAALLTQLDPDEAEVIRSYLQMIQAESFRCQQITARLLDFSRAREASREQTDVARLVGEVIAIMQVLGKFRDRKIEFVADQPCYAEVNGAEIKQVSLNLAANGLEAMGPGGTLRIEIREQTDHLVMKFADEGCGLTPEVSENMFEPFFTRRQNGQGTGLGLSISHRIISQHGGTIVAESPGVGQGTTFIVRLPRSTTAQNAA